MEIIKNSSSELVFQRIYTRNRIIDLLFPVILLLSIVPRFTISCDRVEPELVNCIFRRRSLLPFLELQKQEYHDVKSAVHEVEALKDGDGHTFYLYSISLQAREGKVKLFRSGEPLDKLAIEINDFLDSTDSSLISSRFYSIKQTLLSLFSFGVIVISIIFGTLEKITIVLDKNQNRITHTRFFLLGKLSETFTFNEIQAIEVEDYGGIYAAQIVINPSNSSKISAFLHGKKRKYIVLSGTFFTGGRRNTEERVNVIRQFLADSKEHF